MYYGPLSVLLVGGRLPLAWRSTSEDQSKCLSLALLCSWQQVSPLIFFLQFWPQKNSFGFIFRFVSSQALRIESMNLEPPEPQNCIHQKKETGKKQRQWTDLTWEKWSSVYLHCWMCGMKNDSRAQRKQFKLPWRVFVLNMPLQFSIPLKARKKFFSTFSSGGCPKLQIILKITIWSILALQRWKLQ